MQKEAALTFAVSCIDLLQLLRKKKEDEENDLLTSISNQIKNIMHASQITDHCRSK